MAFRNLEDKADLNKADASVIKKSIQEKYSSALKSGMAFRKENLTGVQSEVQGTIGSLSSMLGIKPEDINNISEKKAAEIKKGGLSEEFELFKVMVTLLGQINNNLAQKKTVYNTKAPR